MRLYYAVGYLFLALCAVAWSRRSGPGWSDPSHLTATNYNGPAGEWFGSVRASCNALEVEMQHRLSPPPAGPQGAGYSAACWALAGRLDKAREQIDALEPRAQRAAADIVFNVGHPVADMGDDQAAGPIMELVLRYQPENYMALYHAGMSAYALGRYTDAGTLLTQFVGIYHMEDGWRNNANIVLGYLRDGSK